jgi:hypothetical protein
MSTVWVWGVAVVLYAAFMAWYVNWRGPVSTAEIERLLARFADTGVGENGRNDLSVMEQFLLADDGREFFMLNVVRMSSSPVTDPATGEQKPSREVMNGYTRMFMPALFARGGHPAFAARKVGGYFDTWGMETGPEWSFIGYIRYRSRRDLAMLASHPKFAAAHDFKFAAMPQTFNFPTQPMIMTLAGPRIWVGLTIALVAALIQIGLLVLARGTGS